MFQIHWWVLYPMMPVLLFLYHVTSPKLLPRLCMARYGKADDPTAPSTAMASPWRTPEINKTLLNFQNHLCQQFLVGTWYLPESRAEQLLCSSTCTWLLEKCCFAGRENREKTRSLSQEVPTFIHSNKTQQVHLYGLLTVSLVIECYRFQPLSSSLWT